MMKISIERARSAATAIVAALFALAFVVAPWSCEGGLELYFGVGIVAFAALAALPFLARDGRAASACLAAGIGYAAIGVVVWIAALFIANVRIMCRLF